MRASAGRHQQVRLAEVLHLHSQEGNICSRKGNGRSSSCVSDAIRIRGLKKKKVMFLSMRLDPDLNLIPD